MYHAHKHTRNTLRTKYKFSHINLSDLKVIKLFNNKELEIYDNNLENIDI